MLQKRSNILFSLIFALFAFAFVSCSAQPYGNNWRKLGETKVNYGIDHDRLNVSVRDGNFKQLKFIVRGGALNMYRCMVRFQNGESQEIDLKHTFKKGSDSRIVNLNGKDRFIDYIDFWYDTKNYAKQRAVVAVWGK